MCLCFNFKTHLSAMACSHLLLLLTVTVTLSLTRSVSSQTFPDDVQALKTVKAAIHPASILPGSCLASWDFAYDPCDSAFGSSFTCGLRCDAYSSSSSGVRLRVTELALDPAGYSGVLSPSLWSLPYLESLDLADNYLAGPIPPPPPSGLPFRLRRLSLSRNALSGAIPPALAPAPALQELYLDGNVLAGPIPPGLAALSQLRRLELQANNLTGEIPDLSPLRGLAFLDASDNALSGGFPLGRLPASLMSLSLRGNHLEGPLPAAAVAALPALQVLDLSHNGLWGAVPGAAFEHPAMEQLGLSHNWFGWVEPPADGGVGSRLVAVDLGHNQLGGFLPPFMEAMPRLSAVSLEANRFTGLIPAAYAVRAAGWAGGRAARFTRLMLSGNYLLGPIPSAMVGGLKDGAAAVSLEDNCLLRCPVVFFFCGSGLQKPQSTCRAFNPFIP